MLILCAFLLAPIGAVFVAATADSEGMWTHLSETVLSTYILNTLGLMGGVAVVSLIFGVGTAWLVARHSFPGRRIMEWALLLPAAVPAYIIAYTYTDFLEYAGPLQGGLRDLFGWQSARDYWFPEIRSMGGAILVLGCALYPYVYMMSRVAFRQTPASLFDVARVNHRNAFWTVALPLARPAVAAGLALVLMETVSDFGTVEYFALETLTLGIFNVWLGMNSLPAAAQIASVTTLFVVTLLVIELYARNRQRFDGGRRTSGMTEAPLSRSRQWLCTAACAVPLGLGFLFPAGVLLGFVLRGHSIDAYGTVLAVTGNSFLVAGLSAFLVLLFASAIVLGTGPKGHLLFRFAGGLSAVGYAFPGTILAIGVLTFSGAIDDILEQLYALVGLSDTTLYLTGSLALVVIACVVRFQAVGYGALSAGLGRVPPNLPDASRVLGRSWMASQTEVVLPLMRGSAMAAALLAFVDVMKELPMTLLLRPFNFDTLATFVYQYAKDELLEQAALPALVIVLAGIIPVVLMNRAIRQVT